MENELKLTDLIEVSMLQKVQDAFSAMTGMAALTTDANGVAVTEGSGFTDYCMKYTRCSALGKKLCEQCDKYGAKQTMATGHAATYFCHSGLIDFSAPIIADGKLIGCFIGGQVLTEHPDEDKVKAIARELDIDEELFWESAQKVRIHPKEEIDRAAHFLYIMANVLSEMAYGKYLANVAGLEIQKTSNMKSDFLANMSHEIRTPMNAVIGLAEMALREDMTPAARDYIGQIKSSGRALLNIINDILDYSKIESGKMEMNEVEYEPLSLLNDVSSIIMTRIVDKDVELLLDIDPNIPHTLLGDDLRLRQVIINLANNATKFTKHGHVNLVARYEEVDDETVTLKIRVEDTGIGIKPEDLEKLFNSFQQVDSKRNRNIEGTGLGLAISKQIVTMMGGSIGVESTYGEGSTFFFEVPQKIVEKKPSIRLKNPEKYIIAGFFGRDDVAKDFASDAAKLGVRTDILSGAKDPKATVDAWLEKNKEKEVYIIVEQSIFDERVLMRLDKKDYPNVNSVLLAEAFEDAKKWNHIEYLKVMKKPLSVLNLAAILEADSVQLGIGAVSEEANLFTAPDARVLIVDDNAINLTVAEGLLEPVKMQVETAQSGAEALKKIEVNTYDIIFMDHMMPELDGVETTRIIRRLHPECDKTPIIALTANAISGTKEMFLSEGMNDFIAKPIEVKVLMNKVRQWLPPEKIKKATEESVSGQDTEVIDESGTDTIPEQIGDLDIKGALSLLGSEKLFWKVMKDYHRVILAKADLIEKYYTEKAWTNYVVEVHALKSASKQIGAKELSDLAASLEAAGNAGDYETIDANTMQMLEQYRAYEPVLAPFFVEEVGDAGVEKESISEDVLKNLLEQMLEALDNLDSDTMEQVVGELKKYAFPESQRAKLEALETAVNDYDFDTCESIVKGWNE